MEDLKFKQLYSELGLINSNERNLTLHSDCLNSSICWEKIEDSPYEKTHIPIEFIQKHMEILHWGKLSYSYSLPVLLSLF